MAIYSDPSGDDFIDIYADAIRSAEYGKEARVPIASAIDRCYQLAVIKAGGPRNNVTKADINVHTDRIKNAVFGEEVRDALKSGLLLCYSARGKNPSSVANEIFNWLINSQTGEDLKNNILMSIVRCSQEVKT